jgi:hypothetical protein
MSTVDEDIQAAEQPAPKSVPWLRLAQLGERLKAANHSPDAFRKELQDANAELVERFRADESVEVLVHARAELIDSILREVWRHRSRPVTRAGHWRRSAATGVANCIRIPTSTS